MLNLSTLELIKLFPHTFATWASDGVWQDAKHLQYISKRIQRAVSRGSGRLIINMPPRHGKSWLISKWTPTWYLANNPDKDVLLCSYGDHFAATWGRQVRNEITQNNKIDLSVKDDNRSTTSFELTQGALMATSGVGGALTGKGGDLIIIDDPHKNYDEAKSVVFQEKIKDWFNSTVYTRKQPDTTFIVLMTRWHENDMTGFLMDEHGDEWEQIILPAIAEEGDELGREEGEALWPERFDIDELKRTQNAVGSFTFNGLYQQRPMGLEGGIIKQSYIRYYEKQPEPDFILISWDLNFKKTDDGSFVVGQVWFQQGVNYFLIDQFRERIGYVETKAAIKSMAEKYPSYNQIMVEAKANGEAILDDLRGLVRGLTPFQSGDSKEARCSAVSPLFEAGNVFINPDASWTDKYIDELCTFPNAKNDDQVDATAQALLTLSRRLIDFEPFVQPTISANEDYY